MSSAGEIGYWYDLTQIKKGLGALLLVHARSTFCFAWIACGILPEPFWVRAFVQRESREWRISPWQPPSWQGCVLPAKGAHPIKEAAKRLGTQATFILSKLWEQRDNLFPWQILGYW